MGIFDRGRNPKMILILNNESLRSNLAQKLLVLARCGRSSGLKITCSESEDGGLVGWGSDVMGSLKKGCNSW